MTHDSRYALVKASIMAMQKSATLALMAVVAVAVVAMALVSAALVTSRTVSSTGSVKAVGVGVYWDSACTNQTSSFSWGVLAPGSTASIRLYVKNNGTIPVTLTASFGNWNPASVAGYMTPSWNCTNYVLGTGLVLAAVLTLAVSPSITGVTNFSFDITLTGTG
jgi:hypothetical protein